MKTTPFAFLLLLLGWLNTGSLAGQTLDEWLRPKKTQLEYLAGHLASLRLYSDALQEGYLLFRQGSELVADIQDGEFSLHKNYFQHRHQWSPAMEMLSGLDQALAILKRLEPEAILMANKIAGSHIDPQVRESLQGSCSHVRRECNRLMLEIENLRNFPNEGDEQKWKQAQAIDREVRVLNRDFQEFKISLYRYLRLRDIHRRDIDWTNKILLK